MANNSSDVGGVKVESDRDVDLTLGDSNRAGSSAFSSELSGMGQIRRPVPVEPRTGEALAHWVAAHWEKVTLVVSVAGAIGAAVVFNSDLIRAKDDIKEVESKFESLQLANYSARERLARLEGIVDFSQKRIDVVEGKVERGAQELARLSQAQAVMDERTSRSSVVHGDSQVDHKSVGREGG
ncbi:hypothetical protein QK899_16785 [Pseudomonas sp. AR5]|nr:hypothetical protein QK899_16785 [Pseudomonas sp. AR5]